MDGRVVSVSDESGLIRQLVRRRLMWSTMTVALCIEKWEAKGDGVVWDRAVRTLIHSVP